MRSASPHSRRLIPLGAALGAALFASAAHAQNANPAPDVAVAPDPLEAQLRRGVELRQQGHDAQALEVFRAAYDATHAPRALAQMGLAEQALGSWLDADAHMRQALAATADPWIAQNHAQLEQSIASIGQHVGQVDVVSNVEGARISVNRAVIGRTPLAAPLRLIAGTATVELSAPGYIPMNRTVVVLAGGRSRESFDLVAVQSPGNLAGDTTAPVPTPTPTTHEARISPLVWIGGGVTVAGGVTAIILAAAGSAIEGDFLGHCPANATMPADDCATRMVSQQGQLNGLAEGVNVLIGVASVGAVALIVGLLTSDYGGHAERAASSSSSSSRAGSAREQARARFAPARTGLGLAW